MNRNKYRFIAIILAIIFLAGCIRHNENANMDKNINMKENVDGINYSIVLLIYEMICIFFTILYLERKSSTIVASNNS